MKTNPTYSIKKRFIIKSAKTYLNEIILLNSIRETKIQKKLLLRIKIGKIKSVKRIIKHKIGSVKKGKKYLKNLNKFSL